MVSPAAPASPHTHQALGNALRPSRDSPSSDGRGRKAASKRHGVLSPERNPPPASPRGGEGEGCPEDAAAAQRPHWVAREPRRPTAVGRGQSGGSGRPPPRSPAGPRGRPRGPGKRAGGDPRPRGRPAAWAFSWGFPHGSRRGRRPSSPAVRRRLNQTAPVRGGRRSGGGLPSRRAGDGPGNERVYTEGKAHGHTPTPFPRCSSLVRVLRGAFQGGQMVAAAACLAFLLPRR